MRYFIELAYDGEPFHGWQSQPNAVTVQENVEKCFGKVFQQKVEITGAGRTDTGVHARHLVAHFDMDQDFDHHQLIYKLNRMLSPAIVISKIYPVQPEAHARFNAIAREYKYYVSLKKDPFTRRFSARITEQIDVKRMNEACEILKQHRDFQCFSKVKTDVYTYNCDISEAKWEEFEDQLVFSITADRFLRNMVRAIVGTLLEIGSGKKDIEDLEEILKSKDRGKAGKSVAAKGLFLHRIAYPESIKLN